MRVLLRLSRFIFRRLVVGIVNLLAGSPDFTLLSSLRGALLPLIGCRVGRKVQLSEQLYIYDGRNLTIGDNCRIGSFAKIWDFCPISLGDDLLASHNVTLISASHELDEQRSNRAGPIVIGRNVWLGINVTIVGPVSIGDDVVVGANSLVVTDLASGGIYAGIPAKPLKSTNIPERNMLAHEAAELAGAPCSGAEEDKS
jgi:acetyltransferase-like isoleucine patch superfamily enzyme